MNRAATEDVRTPVWPVVSRVLETGSAPTPRDQAVVDLLDAWVADDAPRLDANDDTFFDAAGPTIMDAAWRPIAEAAMEPVFGNLVDDLNDVRSLNNSGPSYVDKDLRRLLGEPVEQPFLHRYCGGGSLAECSESLWDVIHETADDLEEEYGSADPATWIKPAFRTSFRPRRPVHHVPFHEPADVPASSRIPKQVRGGMELRNRGFLKRSALFVSAVGVTALALPALAVAHLERPSYWPDPAPDTSVSPPAGGEVPSTRSLASAATGEGPGQVLVVCKGEDGKGSLRALRDSLKDAKQGGYKLRPSQPKVKVSKNKAKKLTESTRSSRSAAATTPSRRPFSTPATTTASRSCPAATPSRSRALRRSTTRPARASSRGTRAAT